MEYALLLLSWLTFSSPAFSQSLASSTVLGAEKNLNLSLNQKRFQKKVRRSPRISVSHNFPFAAYTANLNSDLLIDYQNVKCSYWRRTRLNSIAKAYRTHWNAAQISLQTEGDFWTRTLENSKDVGREQFAESRSRFRSDGRRWGTASCSGLFGQQSQG
jgi:hypothetical protein